MAFIHYITTDTDLPNELIHLVFLRVSQINGCAHCIDLHTRDLLKTMPFEKVALVRSGPRYLTCFLTNTAPRSRGRRKSRWSAIRTLPMRPMRRKHSIRVQGSRGPHDHHRGDERVQPPRRTLPPPVQAQI